MSNDIKIGLIGNSSVGKSSLIRRFVDNKFDDNYMSTIGVDYFEKKIIINSNIINLIIQDTSGEERFRSMSKSYFKNVDGIIFVFDIMNSESFKEGVKYWLTECNNEIGEYKAILVGNKIDLEMRMVKKEEIQHFADVHQLKYFETSAKDGKNVDLVFKELAELILKDLNKKKNKNKKLGNHNNFTKRKKCC